MRAHTHTGACTNMRTSTEAYLITILLIVQLVGVARAGGKESKTVGFRERERERDEEDGQRTSTERESTNARDNRRHTWEQQPTGRAGIGREQGIAKRTCQNL